MKKVSTYLGAVAIGFFGIYSSVSANGCGLPGFPACAVPEPGSLALVIGGLVAAVAVAKYLKK